MNHKASFFSFQHDFPDKLSFSQFRVMPDSGQKKTTAAVGQPWLMMIGR